MKFYSAIANWETKPLYYIVGKETQYGVEGAYTLSSGIYKKGRSKEEFNFHSTGLFPHCQHSFKEIKINKTIRKILKEMKKREEE